VGGTLVGAVDLIGIGVRDVLAGIVERVGREFGVVVEEIALEPLEHAEAVIETGRGAGVAVAFAGIEDETDGGVGPGFEVTIEFEGLSGMHAGIVFAVEDEEWGAALAGVFDGAAIEEEIPIVPGLFTGMDEVHFAGDIGGAEF
jgi:hypothetical protein